MPLPPVATIAACGSILTAFKSGWELSRMIKKKELETRLEKEARSLLKDLQQAYRDGLLTDRSYEKWYDRFLGALADKDTIELRKVRQHIQLVRNDQARLTRRNTIANRTTYYDVPHRQSRSAHATSHSSSSRRHSSSRPEYVVHEYEDAEPRRSRAPTTRQHVDTARAQRDYYYAHALPSPYRGMIEDTPREDKRFDGDEDLDDDDHHRGHGRSTRESSRRARSSHTRSSSSTYERGRTRSQSVRAGHVSDADTDSEAEEKDKDKEKDREGRRGARRGEARSERR